MTSPQRRLTGQVRWLKAVEGGVDIPVLGAKKRVSTNMQRMGREIAGTDDVVAIYIKIDPRPKYNEGKWRPGGIAGILWLEPIPGGTPLSKHAEDSEYEIGWPVADRDLTPGPLLRELVMQLYGSAFDGVWKSLCGSMTGGRPFRIDKEPYARIGKALTTYYRTRSGP